MSKPWKTKEERMAELEQITNQLEEGRYTECVDELIIKVEEAPTKKFRVLEPAAR